MADKRHETGKQGERIALFFLRRNGYRILARNFSTPSGEIDIIAYDHGVLSFVEVKTRTSLEFGAPEAAITSHKMRQIAKVARQYVSRHRLHDITWRFDCVYVMMGENGLPGGLRGILSAVLPFLFRPKAKVELIKDAFDLDSIKT
jgi:putative endonuclease